MYQFEAYRSPFANSIAEMMLRRGDIAARRAEQIGAIQGQAAQQRGQGWANALLGATQAVAAIPGQMQQQKREAVINEMNQLALRQAQRGEADVSALDTAFQKPDRESILNALPGHLRPQIAKQFADADAAALKVKETRQKIQEANNEYLAGLGHAVATHGYDLTAAGLALQHARDTFESANDPEMVKQIDSIAQQIQADPNSLKPIVDNVIGLSPKFTELRQTQQHQAVTEAQAATGAEERARHDKAMENIQKGTGDRATKAAEETARHNREMERLRGLQVVQGEAAPTLTPEALTLTAHQYAMTGQLPPMGMGKAGAATRSAIINEAAKVYKNLDLPTQQAAYKANQESLKKLQVQRDALGAFESTALKNLDVFIEAGKKVIDTGSPLLNQPLRAISGKGLGSAEQTAFETARRTVIPEFAKILANPGLSGQLSDAARKEIEDVVKGNATMKQIIAAATVLRTDTANRRTSYDDEIKAIQQRIATPPGQTTSAAAVIYAKDPSGKVHQAAAGTPLPAGWVQVEKPR